jgi:cold shock CspA family protein
MLTGKLKKWNDDKGYGFIASEQPGQDIFIHISGFKGLVRKPEVGDMVRFEIKADDTGRIRAANAVIDGVPSVGKNSHVWILEPIKQKRESRYQGKPQPSRGGSRRPRSLLPRWLLPLGVAGIAAVYQWTNPDEQAIAPSIPQFQCEGKTRCPEISSCEEAMFYIQNCPGTEMDGDHDGIPCEQQWCR